MQRQPTLRAVVCDDDPVLRTVLRNLLDECGYRVLADVGSATLAIDELDNNRIDLIIVDLALTAGRGEDVLAYVRDRCPTTRAIVFSSFADDVEGLTALGAEAIFEKPDFDPLIDWLRAQNERPTFEASADRERRRPPQPAPVLPERGPTSPSDLEPWTLVRSCVDRLWPGDAILTLDLLEADEIAARGDHVFLLDSRLALGRLVAPSLRQLDRIGATPRGVIVCLLVAGHQEAPAAVFDRLQLAWDRAGLDGTPIGAFGHVRPSEHPEVILERALRRLADDETTATHPLRLA